MRRRQGSFLKGIGLLPVKIDGKTLEALYRKYNRRELIDPDPLVFLYDYPDLPDREIVGLLSASLAFGGVKQIMKSLSVALGSLGGPRSFLINADTAQIAAAFKGFRYRFVSDEDMTRFLVAVKRLLQEFESLENAFLDGMNPADETVLPALAVFARRLNVLGGGGKNYLLPQPDKGGACKRLHLFLRWMARKDDVDPGGWTRVPTSKLLYPVDTHIWKIAANWNLTKRKQPGVRAVLEISAAFRKFCPDDPVKYDFALSRFGIRDELNIEQLNLISEDNTHE